MKQVSIKFSQIIVVKSAESIKSNQAIISDSITKDLLVKRSSNCNHQVLLKKKEDNTVIKNLFVKNIAKFFICPSERLKRASPNRMPSFNRLSVSFANALRSGGPITGAP